MPEMRIGIDYRPAATAPLSGIGRQVRALEQAIAHTAPQHTPVLFTCAPLDHEIRSRAVCPAWGTPLNGFHRPQERWRFEHNFLPSALQDHRIDLYIATANMGLPFPANPHSGIRYIQLLHDVFQMGTNVAHTSTLKRWIYHAIYHFSIRHSVHAASQIWTPSEYTRRQISEKFPGLQQKIFILHNHLTPFSPPDTSEHPFALPHRYWLLVGTREPRKNIPWFLRNWHNLKQTGATLPDLVLIGSPDDLPRELRKIEGLSFFSDISDTRLACLYTQAACLWQPSYAEGFGLPVLEALSLGTPVAVATGSALDEITPPFSPRFAPDNDTQLKTVMLDIARQPLTRQDQRFQTWLEQFSAEQYRNRVRQLLEMLCAS